VVVVIAYAPESAAGVDKAIAELTKHEE